MTPVMIAELPPGRRDEGVRSAAGVERVSWGTGSGIRTPLSCSGLRQSSGLPSVLLTAATGLVSSPRFKPTAPGQPEDAPTASDTGLCACPGR